MYVTDQSFRTFDRFNSCKSVRPGLTATCKERVLVSTGNRSKVNHPICRNKTAHLQVKDTGQSNACQLLTESDRLHTWAMLWGDYHPICLIKTVHIQEDTGQSNACQFITENDTDSAHGQYCEVTTQAPPYNLSDCLKGSTYRMPQERQLYCIWLSKGIYIHMECHKSDNSVA